MENLQSLLKKVRIDPRRLEMFNLSAAMGPRWADICDEFTERVRDLGPSPVCRALWKSRQKEGDAP